MAEAAQNIPQFKLVLVGDGGTGKVSATKSRLLRGLFHSLEYCTDGCCFFGDTLLLYASKDLVNSH
jgi:hypothetical protein